MPMSDTDGLVERSLLRRSLGLLAGPPMAQPENTQPDQQEAVAADGSKYLELRSAEQPYFQDGGVLHHGTPTQEHPAEQLADTEEILPVERKAPDSGPAVDPKAGSEGMERAP